MQFDRFESRRNEARLGLQKLQAQPCVNLLEADPGALMWALMVMVVVVEVDAGVGNVIDLL